MAEIQDSLRLQLTDKQLTIAKEIYRLAGDDGKLKVRSLRQLAKHLNVHRATMTTTINIIQAVNGNAIIIGTDFGSSGARGGTKNKQNKPRSKVSAKKILSRDLDLDPPLEDKSTPQGASVAVSTTLFNLDKHLPETVRISLKVLREFNQRKGSVRFDIDDDTADCMIDCTEKDSKLDLVFETKRFLRYWNKRKVPVLSNHRYQNWMENQIKYRKRDEAKEAATIAPSEGSTAIGDKVRAKMLAEKTKLEANR